MSETVPKPEPFVEGDFDHHSLGFSVDVAGVHAQLRAAECPITRSERYGGFWVLNRYEDVVHVAKSPEIFSSRNDGKMLRGISIPSYEETPTLMPPVDADPPEHMNFRRLLNPAFSGSSMDALAPRLRAMTDWCIDRRAETGEIDLVLDVANPIPAMATLWVLGLPLEGWETWAEPMHDSIGMPYDSPDRPRIAAKMDALNTRIAEAIDDQRSNPSGGLLSVLVEAQIDGQPLPDATLFGICYLLLAAGVDTTTALISGTLEYLERHPDLRTRLKEDASLLPTACEEFVRYLTPNPTEARTVTVDTEVAGVQMRTGDRVLISWFAGNHDPAKFDHPDDVVLDRARLHTHVGFGSGIHRCVGAPLARTVFLTVIPQILDRLPDYQIDRQRLVPYEDRGSVNGFFEMPASFTPTSRVGVDLPVRSDPAPTPS
jgi:cytochrome P450